MYVIPAKGGNPGASCIVIPAGWNPDAARVRLKSRAMPIDITVISAMRALIEIAMLMLLARGVLWLFGPRARQGNFFYDIMTIIATPFIRAMRAITPRIVRDAYIPAMAFVLVVCLWLALGIAKAAMCASRGLECL